MAQINKILAYLPENKVKELQSITRSIIGTKMAEMIILFGSYARGNYKEQKGIGKKSDYDILVITKDRTDQKALKHQASDLFEDIFTPVQLIVESIDFVNSNLEEKQYFFTDIKREGKVLFNSGKYQLADSQKLTSLQRRKMAEKDFKEWFTKAKKVMNEVRSDVSLAAFDLQQVVEMCYTTIEMVFSHYNPHEHNLALLRRRVLEFDRRIEQALPYESEEQIELFDHLNFAYIGGRYRSEEEFPVTIEQLDYWNKEAKKLLDLTQAICEEKIEQLKAVEREWMQQ